MKTILQKCDKFHICIIDDNSFDKLIPEWNDNIRYQVPANERRLLGKLTLLYMYGGLCVPCSFLCMHDLFPIYESYCLEKGQWFLGEERNTGASSFNAVFQGNFEFMGAPKHDTSVNEFIGLLTNKRQVIFDNVDFDGEKSRWCQNLPVLDGKLIGTKDTNNEPVLVSELLSTHMISFDKRTYGVLIPAQEILTRTAYQWFARLSEKQVLKTNVTLGKLILLETTRSNAVGLAGMGKGEIEEDTINFWSLPKE